MKWSYWDITKQQYNDRHNRIHWDSINTIFFYNREYVQTKGSKLYRLCSMDNIWYRDMGGAYNIS